MRRTEILILATTLLAWSGSVFAAPVKLPSATPIELELQHHITSAYVPAGAPIYFRVAHDIVIDGQTVIARGTLVTGQMRAAVNRSEMATSGTMALGIRHVTAADGKRVRVIADMTRQGRDRSGAMVWWTIFWGLPGLVTQGLNPHVERGAIVVAEVLNETLIEPQPARDAPDAPPAPAANQVPITGYKYIGISGSVLRLNLEQSRKLGSLKFLLKPPPDLSDVAADNGTFELIAIDGVAVPERVLATKVGPDFATFDTWSIVRFCHDGNTELRFRGISARGATYDATYALPIKIINKG